MFIVFYWAVPAWLNYQLSTVDSHSVLRPVVEMLFARRVHWVQWLGIALSLICAFFAIYNYLELRRLNKGEERDVSILGRLIARFIN